MIGFTELTVRYGGTTALGGISGQVRDGEWLGLIGPNGAGKTTLLNAIARLTPYTGSVTVGDRPTGRLSRRELARLIAYVPQRPLLPPDMTVSDYVLLGRTAHIGYLRSETAADRRVCGAAIDRLDLGAMAARTLQTMSGGELQRVVLARAIAQEAPVLLLDEPTSALDLGRRMDALELIDEVRRERSLTVLSAIHDLTLAGQFADRLVLLVDGQIAASGSGRPKRSRRRARPRLADSRCWPTATIAVARGRLAQVQHSATGADAPSDIAGACSGGRGHAWTPRPAGAAVSEPHAARLGELARPTIQYCRRQDSASRCRRRPASNGRPGFQASRLLQAGPRVPDR